MPRWLIVAAAVAAPTVGFSAPSDLDTAFGTAGTVTFAAAATSTLFGPASATLAALQPDGKLLVVVGVEQAISGASNPSKLSWQIRRYTTGGALDPTFGTAGIVTLSFDVDFNGFRGSDRPGGLTLLPNGRFVVVGQSIGQCAFGCEGSLLMARFNSNGSLDSGFGVNGKVVTNTLLGADAVAAQSDGKIVIAANQNIGRAQIWTIDLYRFNVDGSLDATFAGARPCSGNGSIRMGPDRKIVLVTAIPAFFADPAANPGFCVSRLNADGTVDTTFGTNGKTVVKPGVNVTLGGFSVDPTGATTVVGSTTTAITFRLTPSGTLDTQFGAGGIVETTAASRITAATGDCLLRTVVAAPAAAGTGGFSTARYLRSGLIDPAFAPATNGFSQISTATAASPIQLLLRPNGRIVAVTVDQALRTVSIAQFLGDGACLASGAAVLEFFNTNLNTYFITADPSEAAAIDNGAAGPGWIRTGLSFKSGGSQSVCRFYGSLSPGPNSHFYTVSGAECSGLLQIQAVTPITQKRWNFESLDFASTPANSDGTCPGARVPVYRAYNNGFKLGIDSNHRITTSLTAIQDVVSRGWINEGVVLCAPQ